MCQLWNQKEGVHLRRQAWSQFKVSLTSVRIIPTIFTTFQHRQLDHVTSYVIKDTIYCLFMLIDCLTGWEFFRWRTFYNSGGFYRLKRASLVRWCDYESTQPHNTGKHQAAMILILQLMCELVLCFTTHLCKRLNGSFLTRSVGRGAGLIKWGLVGTVWLSSSDPCSIRGHVKCNLLPSLIPPPLGAISSMLIWCFSSHASSS